VAGRTLFAGREGWAAMTAGLRRGPDDPASLNLRHHGDDELAPGLVDLAVNVRPGGPPAWLRKVLADSLSSLSVYPKPDGAREAIAARHRRRQSDVLVTAGAAEAFSLIARAFTPRQAIVIHPQFTEPELALRVAGHRVDRLLLSPEDGFTLPDYGIPASADLVVVGNPTNPTSTLHPAEALAGLARPGRLLVVDEAFMDAVPGESQSLAWSAEIPGLIVVRSFTKTWGLAGLRIGYVLAAPDLIDALAAVQPHWSVSTPGLAAAVACSSPTAIAEAQAIASRTATDRAYLVKCLDRFDGVEVVGVPQAPFVLLQVRNGRKIRQRLRERGWAVRRGDSFPGLGPTWMRVAVRDPATTDGFLDALATVQLEGACSATGEGR
jgi:histidinol-phosphate aminotransferase